MDQEPVTPTSVVAARVRELRSARQWSAQRVSDEMNNVGIDWNRGVVSKLETGRRESISVAELLALAVVFDVSPLSLLVPSEPCDYAIAPNRVATITLRVYDWFVGRDGLPFGEQTPSVDWWGIPSGLPEHLMRREVNFAKERDAELSELRIRNAALEAEAKSRPHADPSTLLALLERTERGVQEAERQAQMIEAARQRQADLVREFLRALPEEQRGELGGLLAKLNMESQAGSADGE